tara:strand:+ start:297 stop:491 length:195 start_codon:yes stop_codon:yes gene_type:complete
MALAPPGSMVIERNTMKSKSNGNFLRLKVEITKRERNLLKAKAAIAGVSTQKLVGSLVRTLINQ